MEERKRFFFEKKKQKTFAKLASAFPQRLSLNLSKFFGSFFQKRTAFFAACLPWRRSPYLGSYQKTFDYRGVRGRGRRGH
jgi:hypothetical protein